MRFAIAQNYSYQRLQLFLAEIFTWHPSWDILWFLILSDCFYAAIILSSFKTVLVFLNMLAWYRWVNNTLSYDPKVKLFENHKDLIVLLILKILMCICVKDEICFSHYSKVLAWLWICRDSCRCKLTSSMLVLKHTAISQNIIMNLNFYPARPRKLVPAVFERALVPS